MRIDLPGCDLHERKSCYFCNNRDCFIVYGLVVRKDCLKHHEIYDYDKVFDCKNQSKYKGG